MRHHYITVVSAVVGSTSIVPTTASDTVDGHPAAASTEETVAAVFGSVSESLSDTRGPSTAGTPLSPSIRVYSNLRGSNVVPFGYSN